MARLTNQLGRGTIPEEEECNLIAEGTRFAAYFRPSCGAPILVTSTHPDIYQRWVEQIGNAYASEIGLPSEYRTPVVA